MITHIVATTGREATTGINASLCQSALSGSLKLYGDLPNGTGCSGTEHFVYRSIHLVLVRSAVHFRYLSYFRIFSEVIEEMSCRSCVIHSSSVWVYQELCYMVLHGRLFEIENLPNGSIIL